MVATELVNHPHAEVMSTTTANRLHDLTNCLPISSSFPSMGFGDIAIAEIAIRVVVHKIDYRLEIQSLFLRLK